MQGGKKKVLQFVLQAWTPNAAKEWWLTEVTEMWDHPELADLSEYFSVPASVFDIVHHCHCWEYKNAKTTVVVSKQSQLACARSVALNLDDSWFGRLIVQL